MENELKYNYRYFFNMYDDNEIFLKLIEGVENVWEIREKGKEYLETEIKEKDVKENNGELLGRVTLIGSYYIGEGTKIYDGVTIEGPVYIGKNVEIKPGAYIRPGTIISDNCSIGFNSEVKCSVLQKGAKVASLAFVGDSILGRSARIGSGVITSNRRFDQGNIRIKKATGERVEIESDFFGLVLGDCSRMGANSVSYPGTFIGAYTWIFPVTQVHGFIPEMKKVSNKQQMYMTDNQKLDLKS